MNSRSSFSHRSSVIWWIFKCLEISHTKINSFKVNHCGIRCCATTTLSTSKTVESSQRMAPLNQLLPVSNPPTHLPLPPTLTLDRLPCISEDLPVLHILCNGMAVACVASFTFCHVFKVQPHRDQIISPLMCMLQSYLSLYPNGAGYYLGNSM